MLFSGTKLSDLSKASVTLLLVGVIALGLSFYIFMDITLSILAKEKFAIDQAAFNFVKETSFSGVEIFMKSITQAGSVIVMVILSLLLAGYLLFFSPFSRWVGVYFILGMGGVSGLTKALKMLSSRDRPEFMGDFHGTSSSFPSGHTSGAIVFYGFVIYLIAVSRLKSRWKWFINSIVVVLTLLITISRLYLGVHFFTDIVAGFLFGLIWLFICIAALEITLWHQRRRQTEEQSVTESAAQKT
ncbi:phosphatase PAP2 family protein [Halobacillus litoralis]|uniref:phosphatase PAP2 family protein n=1 Tax=Halobacillus litoralis TaxID=45668 RepID=UPI001CFD5D17|nr:phosphatase PAP2 family protein [Halobacillus litoralis]